jgi:hypothetical protein
MLPGYLRSFVKADSSADIQEKVERKTRSFEVAVRCLSSGKFSKLRSTDPSSISDNDKSDDRTGKASPAEGWVSLRTCQVGA